MLDGIAFLRDTLAPLESTTVAVLVIGESFPRVFPLSPFGRRA
jgi:hypothetical protein